MKDAKSESRKPRSVAKKAKPAPLPEVDPFAPLVSAMFDRIEAKETERLKRKFNPEPPEEMTPAEIVKLMNAPLWKPSELPSKENERESLALAELLRAGQGLRQAYQGEADLATLGRFVLSAGEACIAWLAARAAQDDCRAAKHLVALRVASKAAVDQIPAESIAGKTALMESKRIGAQKKPIGSPKGGRKFDLSQGDNLAVVELRGKIEAYRDRWSVVNSPQPAMPPVDVLPIPAACIALDDFSPETWPAWHEVGKMILRDEGKGASSHLKAAWERLAKLPPDTPVTPLFF